MRKQGYVTIVAVLGGAALLAAACAPASTPSQPQTTTTQPAAAPQQQAAPQAQQPAAQPAQPKPAAPAAQEAAKPTKSVSGIPLDPNVKFGGTLRITFEREGPTFSQWEERGGVSPLAGNPLTNMLVQHRTWGDEKDYNQQAYNEIHPDLAVSWEQSRDGLQWTFKLREGVKWTDGVPFTCADAKWSLDSLRTGKGLKRSPAATHYLAIKDIQCPDALTLVVSLGRSKPGLLEVLAFTSAIVLPKHVYENDTDLMRQKPYQAGTGPFTLKEWTPGEKYVFVKKQDYWNKPFPYVDTIEMQLLSATNAATAMRAGRIDLANYGLIQGGAAITLANECKGCQVWPNAVTQGASALMVNHQRPPWNTPEIKDAISLAIDKVKASKVYRGGYSLPGYGGWFYVGSYWAMPKERLAQIPGYDFDNPDKNKQRARELLAKAGYKPNELTLPLSVGTYSTDLVPPIVEDLQAVGFKVVPTQYEIGRTYEVMGSGDFNVMLHGFWDAGIDPDFVLYEHFYTGSDRNPGRYSNPNFDRLVDEMSVTLDKEQRRRKAWDAVEMAMRDQAKVHLGSDTHTPILGPRTRGFMPHPGHMWYGPARRLEHVWVQD